MHSNYLNMMSILMWIVQVHKGGREELIKWVLLNNNINMQQPYKILEGKHKGCNRVQWGMVENEKLKYLDSGLQLRGNREVRR